MKIQYVPYGLANNFGDHIEIHKDLKKYPNLHEFILKHELDHKSMNFSFSDLLLDMTNFKYTKEMFKFMLNRPSTWIQFSPLYKSNKGYFWDFNLLFIYIINLLAIAGIIALILMVL